MRKVYTRKFSSDFPVANILSKFYNLITIAFIKLQKCKSKMHIRPIEIFKSIISNINTFYVTFFYENLIIYETPDVSARHMTLPQRGVLR